MDTKSGHIEKLKEVIVQAAAKAKPENKEHDDGPPWLKYVAMLTGILAALAGFLTVRSTVLVNDAIYQSNQAIMAQTQSSDAWAEYQADSIKARIIEAQMLPSSTLSPADKATLAKEDSDIRDRQPTSKKLAQDKAAERETFMGNGLKSLARKDLLGYAEMLIQLGIALASVAAMVRMRSAFTAAAVIGGIGILITAYAMLLAG